MAEITSELIKKTADIQGPNESITTETARENELKHIDKTKELSLGINPPIKKGNPAWIKGVSANPKGRPKKRVFSIREDLIKSLKRIKKKKPELYQKIIDSYWEDGKMRQFLLEIVDGKARQSVEMSGTMENPVRVIEVKQLIEKQDENL